MNNIWGHLWQLNSRLPALVCNLADGDSNYIYVQTRLKFRPCVSGEGGWEEVRQLLVKKQQRKKKWKEFRITRSVSNFFLVNFLFPPFWKGVGWAAPGRQRFLSPAAVDIWNVSAIGSLKFNYKREKQVQLQQNQLLVFFLQTMVTYWMKRQRTIAQTIIACVHAKMRGQWRRRRDCHGHRR